MPTPSTSSGSGSMYVALSNNENVDNNVYRSTTTSSVAPPPGDGTQSRIMGAVRRVFQFGSASDVRNSDDDDVAVMKLLQRSSHPLSEKEGFGIDCDMELRSIELQQPAGRCLEFRKESSDSEGLASTFSRTLDERVQTSSGTSILVAIQGDRSKPPIVTYHDLGLNYVSNYQSFFNYVDMRVLLHHFCVFHINAPGQEEGAATLPENYVYPTMDELAEQVGDVMSQFGLQHVVGFGVGAGANILARFALRNPTKVDALCLINCISTQAGWIEWGYQKLNSRHLRTKGVVTQAVLDYLMWHHFGKLSEERNHDLSQVYSRYFERQLNPTNLSLFIDSYIRRTDLNISRGTVSPVGRHDLDGGKTLRMPVLNVTGVHSPHVDDTVTLNGRLDPSNSTWMKIQDCGMVLEEQPGKVSEAFRLFLQGQGYALKLRKRSNNVVVGSSSCCYGSEGTAKQRDGPLSPNLKH